MECRTCSESLTALLDNELSLEERRAIDVHLAGCPACQEELSSLQVSRQMTDALSEIPVPADLWLRVQRELSPAVVPAEAPSRRSRWWRELLPRPWIPVAGAAGLLAALVVFISLDRPNPLEQDFATFLQHREQQAGRTLDAVLDRDRFERYQFDRNPFIQPVQLNENPFRSDAR